MPEGLRVIEIGSGLGNLLATLRPVCGVVIERPSSHGGDPSTHGSLHSADGCKVEEAPL